MPIGFHLDDIEESYFKNHDINMSCKQTDHKFTEEQIMEALEIRMPHDAVCREAYDLINRQKAEIEEQHQAIINALKRMGEIRSEAYKEFAERLKANMSNIARMEYGGNIYFCVGYGLVDTLVKEMTEGKNESQSTKTVE